MNDTDNGKVVRGRMVFGKKEGMWEYWYPGAVWSKRKESRGTRSIHIYQKRIYLQGQRKALGKYENGKRQKLWVYWKEDGSFRDSTGWYSEDKFIRKPTNSELA